MSVRIGTIGVGHWHAPRHLDSFVAAGAAVVAVCADEPGVAGQWAQRLGARAYDDHRQLLRDGGLDLVLAMPRHRDGPALLTDLTAAGLPFVVEKPAATTAGDLLPHVLSVEASGQFAAVPFVNRYSTFLSRLRELRLDPVSTARFRIVNGPPDRYLHDGVAWVLDPEIGGGGALRNLGTHTVDAYLAVAHGPVEVVGSVWPSVGLVPSSTRSGRAKRTGRACTPGRTPGVSPPGGWRPTPVARPRSTATAPTPARDGRSRTTTGERRSRSSPPAAAETDRPPASTGSGRPAP
jgi:predicted dehydrogenase